MSWLMRLAVVAMAGRFTKNYQGLVKLLLEVIQVQREQIQELNGGKRKRLTDHQRLRLAVLAQKLPRSMLVDIQAWTFSPDTFLRWYRCLIHRKYTHPGVRKGREVVNAETVNWVLELARKNPGWGYRKIVGALDGLAIPVSKSTVARILREHGAEPSPQRKRTGSWKAFFERNWQSLYATDFFTVEVLKAFGTMRYHVMTVMHLSSRKVEIAGIVPEPYEAYVVQVARNLTAEEVGFLKERKPADGKKLYLIHDRASVFGSKFKKILQDEGVETVKLPPRSPNLNAHLERFHRTIREECLNHYVLVSERQLRYLVREYCEFYNRERFHQGLGNRLIEDRELPNTGTVVCKERLNGLLRFYHREAA